MRTAVDTDVLVALFSGDEETSRRRKLLLRTLVPADGWGLSRRICGLVAGRDATFVERFLWEKASRWTGISIGTCGAWTAHDIRNVCGRGGSKKDVTVRGVS